MVDCGSMNILLKHQNVKFKNYVINHVIPRYIDIKKKSFLLTHFHKDHINGFKYILKQDANFFNKIYIPQIPKDKNGRSILLELAVFSFVFLSKKTNCAQMNIAPMFIFSLIYKCIKENEITVLKSADIFEALNCKYEVINSEEYQSFSTIVLSAVEKIESLLGNCSYNLKVKKLMEVKEKFCRTYFECSTMCNISFDVDHENLISKIDELNNYIVVLSNISKELSGEGIAYKISQILEDENVQSEYSNLQNEFSLVFQNKSDCADNILMTGDATRGAILNMKDKLFKQYRIFKAPHHGTEGNYCEIFDNILKDHVIISNGIYHAGGKISKKYCDGFSINHCTDCTVCGFFTENKTCCNRLKYCESNKELSLKCEHNGVSSGVSTCNIYVVSDCNDRGCFCDE